MSMLTLSANPDGTVDCICVLGTLVATFANMDRATEYIALLDERRERILTEPDSRIRGGAVAAGKQGNAEP